MKNGQIWYHPAWCLYAISQWLTGDLWVLLSGPGRATHGGTCMVAKSEKDGQVLYSEAQLKGRLRGEGWQRVEADLVLYLSSSARYLHPP